MDEIEAHILGRKHTITSSTSTSEPWLANLQDTGDDILSSTFYSPPYIFSNDVSFLPDEAKLSSPSALVLQLGFEPALQPPQDVASQNWPLSFAETENFCSQDIPEPKAISTTSSPSSSSSYHAVSRKRKAKKCKLPIRGIVSRSGSQSRKSHNAIEKRYCTSVNNSFSRLHRGVPPVLLKKINCRSVEDNGGSITEKENQVSRHKDGKGAVLVRALEYIKQLEAYTKSLCNEIGAPDTRLRAFELPHLLSPTFTSDLGLKPYDKPNSNFLLFFASGAAGIHLFARTSYGEAKQTTSILYV